MTPTESADIIALLGKAYPRFEMPDESTVLYQRMLGAVDYRVAYRAALEWVKCEKWFPTIAEFREYARTARRDVESEQLAAAKATASKPETAGDSSSVPEWVQVWHWRRMQTLTARQAANTTTLGPVEDKPPVRMREFPQFPQPLAPDAYTFAEYQRLHQDWLNAGAPTIHELADLLEGTVTG